MKIVYKNGKYYKVFEKDVGNGKEIWGFKDSDLDILDDV